MTSEIYIQKLKLKIHPEGGYYREIYRSVEKTRDLPDRYSGQARSLATSIYYLLKGTEFSAFHKLESDEIWHFYEGSALQLFVFDHTGELNTKILGSEIQKGESHLIIVPRNCWFAAQPKDPSGYTLAGCTVSPGFDFSDFQMAEKAHLLKKYPGHTSLITRYTK